MYAQLMRKPMILCLFLVCSVARGQGASRLHPTGAETKAHAGAGQLESRSSAAVYYNPANLALGEGSEVQGEFDFIAADYTFHYPGYDPVKIHVRTPAPDFGFVFRPVEGLSVGVKALVLPGGKSKPIRNFPTRTFAEDADSDPVLLDVETGSKGPSYSAAVGGAYELGDYAIGLSVLADGGTSTLKATESDGDGVLVESKSRNRSHQVVLGGRGAWSDGRVDGVLTVQLPAHSQSKGRTDYPALDGGVDTSSEGKGPLAYGAGVKVRATEKLSPFVEVLHTDWRALRANNGRSLFKKVDVDYYDTNDVSLGVDVATQGNTATAAAGFYQSELGDGIMAKESNDGVERQGFGMQDVESIGFKTYALGYRIARKTSDIQTGLTYSSGERFVGRKSRGYGSYELRYFSIVAGGIWRL